MGRREVSHLLLLSPSQSKPGRPLPKGPKCSRRWSETGMLEQCKSSTTQIWASKQCCLFHRQLHIHSSWEQKVGVPDILFIVGWTGIWAPKWESSRFVCWDVWGSGGRRRWKWQYVLPEQLREVWVPPPPKCLLKGMRCRWGPECSSCSILFLEDKEAISIVWGEWSQFSWDNKDSQGWLQAEQRTAVTGRYESLEKTS